MKSEIEKVLVKYITEFDSYDSDCIHKMINEINDIFSKRKSVLQDWVLELPGLRHQGVILTAVRGYDGAPKEDASKDLARCLRETFLCCFVGDSKKSVSFIEKVTDEELQSRMKKFLHSMDQYNIHYVMHLLHAAEIVGYFHPDVLTASRWNLFYRNACYKLHLQPEGLDHLNERLLRDEVSFGKAQETNLDL